MRSEELSELRDALRYFSEAGTLMLDTQAPNTRRVAFCAEHEGLLWLAAATDGLPGIERRRTSAARVRFSDGWHEVELRGTLSCTVDAQAAAWLESPLVEQALRGSRGPHLLLGFQVARCSVRDVALETARRESLVA